MEQMIKKFSPRLMSDDLILNLSTGREKLIEKITSEMAVCLKPGGNQHFLIYGPRGMGKSFFTRLLEINHNKNKKFKNSLFILFPEEQDNIEFVADIMDMIAVKLEDGNFQQVFPRWEITENDWQESKKRLKLALEKANREKQIQHVFFSMENLQEFIPNLDDIENGRLREFLEVMDEITMIGSSIRPDMDNDYSKKLFQVFKKIFLAPWSENDFLAYIKRLAKYRNQAGILKQHNLEHKVKAISKFSGGSPRIAMILSDMIIDDKIVKPINLLNGLVDELTPYYQDLTRAIPPKSKKLFDALIRAGENMTQTQLAKYVGRSQSTIARSFVWLLDNFYVTSIKQKNSNTKHFYIRDRIYVLFYQSRQVYSDHPFSFIESMISFLKEFYKPVELRKKVQYLLEKEYDEGRYIAAKLLEESGVSYQETWSKDEILKKFSTIDDKEKYNDLLLLYEAKKYEELILVINKIPDSKSNYNYVRLLGIALKAKGDIDGAIVQYKKAIELNQYSILSKVNLLEIYIGQKDQQSINKFLASVPEEQILDVANETVKRIMSGKREEDFYVILTILDIIQKIKNKFESELFIMITNHLYKTDKMALLDDLVSEYTRKDGIDEKINMYLEVWQYILDPDQKDIAAIQPEIRITIEAILEGRD